jgi:hypothetical protein
LVRNVAMTGQFMEGGEFVAADFSRRLARQF